MSDLAEDYFKKVRHCDTLKGAFTTFLPKDFRCRIRYAHTPPRPCDPLFSPCPGMEPEKTKLASHFLTVSVPAHATTTPNNASPDAHIFVFAMEVLIYSTAGLTTMFISKADSTGYLSHRRPSPLKSIASTFLWWLSSQQRRATPRNPTHPKRLVISLFARSQPAYLFPGSADNAGKHILDDRQLIKWWARVLDPLFPSPEIQEPEYQGYMTVPGYPGNEIKRFLPPSALSQAPHWTSGNPLPELAQARGLPPSAPPRCLLPRFPDDPKARFMTDLDAELGLAGNSAALTSTSTSTAPADPSTARGQGVWNTITGLDRFWEAMEFRQECSSGRVVGFLWLVIRPSADLSQDPNVAHPLAVAPEKFDAPASQSSLQLPSSQQSQNRSPSRDSARSSSRRRSPLKGPIHPRQPRPKGASTPHSSQLLCTSATVNPSDPSNPNTRDGAFLTAAGYDRAITSLTNLDYSTTSAAAHSTKKWVAEVSSMGGLREESWGIDVVGTAEVEAAGNTDGAPVTNDLGGLVRKRKKATT